MSKMREQALLNKIRDLEEDLEKANFEIAKYKGYLDHQKDINSSLRERITNYESRIKTLEMQAANIEELKMLRIDNDKLKIQIRNMEKNNPEREMLINISRMIKPFTDNVRDKRGNK